MDELTNTLIWTSHLRCYIKIITIFGTLAALFVVYVCVLLSVVCVARVALSWIDDVAVAWIWNSMSLRVATWPVVAHGYVKSPWRSYLAYKLISSVASRIMIKQGHVCPDFSSSIDMPVTWQRLKTCNNSWSWIQTLGDSLWKYLHSYADHIQSGKLTSSVSSPADDIELSGRWQHGDQ